MGYQASCVRFANDPSPGEKNGGATGMTSVIVQKGAQTLTNDHKSHIIMTCYSVANKPYRTKIQPFTTSWYQIYFAPTSDKKHVSVVLLFA